MAAGAAVRVRMTAQKGNLPGDVAAEERLCTVDEGVDKPSLASVAP